MKLKTALLGAVAAFALAPAAHAERGSDGEVKVFYYQAVSVLNAYLSSLIVRIKAHGGDIVKFAGDAALKGFQGHDHRVIVILPKGRGFTFGQQAYDFARDFTNADGGAHRVALAHQRG